ncbi:MAG: hypothetical protein HS104_10930 [Polyangiaceae bacterium]|nr:hypothetical protein [Polyangiaceae bacterium]MCL4748700.1 hypothetical protein [Myxococcales bacterium]
MTRLRSVAVVAAALAAGCATGKPAQGPKETLDAYAQALKAGRTEQAYSLLSDEAKKQLPFEAFARMVKENPEEVRDIATALARPSGPPLVTASVTAPNGESLLLVYEGGQWRVDGSAIDLYSQASPEAAVRAFIRAFENKRWDVLMRFVPDGKKEGLDAGKLKKAWEGEQKDELARLTQALAAALPTAKFERIGERATMSYGAGGTVELLREGGAWKVEEFR